MRMTGSARLLLSARKAAGLTQRALARRARTSQSVIARIESGATSPSWQTLERLLNRAGFELRASVTVKQRVHSHMLGDITVFGAQVQAASLRDIPRSKLKSRRPQHQHDVILLKQKLKRR